MPDQNEKKWKMYKKVIKEFEATNIFPTFASRSVTATDKYGEWVISASDKDDCHYPPMIGCAFDNSYGSMDTSSWFALDGDTSEHFITITAPSSIVIKPTSFTLQALLLHSENRDMAVTSILGLRDGKWYTIIPRTKCTLEGGSSGNHTLTTLELPVTSDLGYFEAFKIEQVGYSDDRYASVRYYRFQCTNGIIKYAE